MAFFFRSTSPVFFLLFLAAIVSALPINIDARQLAIQSNGADITLQISGLRTDAELVTGFNSKDAAETYYGLRVFREIVVTTIGNCVAAVYAIGGNVNVDVSTKVGIVVKIMATFTAFINLGVIIQLCISIDTKLGLLVILGLLTQIDPCLQFFLTTMGICASGIIALVAKVVANNVLK